MVNDISVLALANESFRSKRFAKSLHLYREAMQENPDLEAVCRFNISLASKKRASQDKVKRCGSIAVVRVIGNDLPGLHSENQSLSNLEFILKYEAADVDIENFFVVNRLVSKKKRERIISLLKEYDAKYYEIKFCPKEFLGIGFDTEDVPSDEWLKKNYTKWNELCYERSKRVSKNAYLMNNNGARNKAIELGFSLGCTWVFPFDGNCFLSKPQLEKLKEIAFGAASDVRYLVVPMQRTVSMSKQLILMDGETADEEPQVGFHKLSALRFDERRVYGNQPKVELLKALGVPGVWDKWMYEYPWKLMEVRKEGGYGVWSLASSVFRLPSGNTEASIDYTSRSNLRARAVVSFLDSVFDYCSFLMQNKSSIDYHYFESALLVSEENELKSIETVFDRVYLVSLKEDIEKRLKVQKQLHRYGVVHEVFEAVNGYCGDVLLKYNEYSQIPLGELDFFSEYSSVETRRGVKLIESPGAMGYIFTYIEIIKDAKSKGYENILILEDDVVLCHDFLRRMASFVEAIPSGWKVVNLGSSQYGWGKIDYFDSLSKGYYFPRIEDTKGSFAIGFNSSVFDELIFYQEKFEAAFDNLPLGVLYENHLGRCFNAFPYLVMPDVSASTIRGGRDQYSHANRMNWWVGDFDYPQKRLLVGIIITSNTNLSLYLDSKKDFLEYCDVVFYMKGENGILPVHNLSQCSEGDFLPFLEDDLDDVSVSVDVLIKVKPECVLSDSMLLGAVESFYSGTELPDGLDVIKSGSDDVVKGRVSVVVPTYKRPHNLRAALASVLDQDYGDIELLVVDDNGEGSDFSSATKEIVALLQSQYPHRTIKYLAHKVNANGAAARNTGIFRSSGEYIAFLDDDDIYLPGRVSQAVDFLRYTNNDCGAVYCGFLGWNSKELDLGRFAEGDLTLNILLLDYHSHYFHTNTVTYKRSSVFRINGFDSSYKRHQDLEFGLRFFEHYKVGVVKECLVRLSPEKSEVDNKVYGDEFVALKNKFLTEFAALIDKQDASVRDDIYSAHRGEVVKYAGSLDGVCF